jgi:REP element-mobilizing transposase RayT
MADLVRQAALPFAQTNVSVLWLAADHLHLYLDASPEYALDEIVHAIREYLERELPRHIPAWQQRTHPVWEHAYCVEGIG